MKNIASPQVLGKQYTDVATTQAARVIAHKFANEIIFRLGGGINGIAETQIFYISSRGGHKEIWAMDYDGANQHAVTTLGTISLSPHVSPDGSRLAFSSFTGASWEIRMFSFDLNRVVSFPRLGGTNLSPAWSPDGSKLAFSSSRSGKPEIHVVDQSGGNLHRITNSGTRMFHPSGTTKPGRKLPGSTESVIFRKSSPRVRWNKRSAFDRPGLRGIAGLVTERPVPGVLLDSPLRSRRSRCSGHLHYGCGQQTVGTVDPRWRAKRLSIVVS